MTDPVWTAIIAAAAVVVSAAISAWAARYAARRSNRIEASKVDAAAYESARQTWQEHVDSLREQVAELKGRVEELSRAQAEDKLRISQLSARIEAWSAYTRQLVRLLREHAIEYPPPPASLDEGVL